MLTMCGGYVAVVAVWCCDFACFFLAQYARNDSCCCFCMCACVFMSNGRSTEHNNRHNGNKSRSSVRNGMKRIRFKSPFSFEIDSVYTLFAKRDTALWISVHGIIFVFVVEKQNLKCVQLIHLKKKTNEKLTFEMCTSTSLLICNSDLAQTQFTRSRLFIFDERKHRFYKQSSFIRLNSAKVLIFIQSLVIEWNTHLNSFVRRLIEKCKTR